MNTNDLDDILAAAAASLQPQPKPARGRLDDILDSAASSRAPTTPGVIDDATKAAAKAAARAAAKKSGALAQQAVRWGWVQLRRAAHEVGNPAHRARLAAWATPARRRRIRLAVLAGVGIALSAWAGRAAWEAWTHRRQPATVAAAVRRPARAEPSRPAVTVAAAVRKPARVPPTTTVATVRRPAPIPSDAVVMTAPCSGADVVGCFAVPPAPSKPAAPRAVHPVATPAVRARPALRPVARSSAAAQAAAAAEARRLQAFFQPTKKGGRP